MRCNHLNVSNVHVSAKCKSPLSDCGVAYDKTCAGCEYLEINISYDISRS